MKKLNLRKRITCFLLVLAVALTAVPGGVALPENVQASTASTNKKAVAAYRKMMAKPLLDWKWSPEENYTKNMKFACLDLNKDGIKELVVCNLSACYASGMYKIYAYQKGKVKEIYGTSDDLTFYKNKAMIYEEGAHTGGHWDTYYVMDKNGKLVNKATKAGMDSKISIPNGNKIQYTTKKDGNTIYYYFFSVNGKEVSYKKYKAAVKALKKNAKKTKVIFRENTAANRKKYIKA